MRQAARAIIIEDNKILVMHRNNEGNEYFTLVGGRVNDGESIEQALLREVKEETGLTVTAADLVFIEEHPEPYNEQFTYLCHVAPHKEIAIQEASEEAVLNKLTINMHEPMWVDISSFKRLAFRTPQLQDAILDALVNGFTANPRKL